jgi:hypothetical protein
MMEVFFMGIFRKNIEEIIDDYTEAGIQNDTLEFYQTAKEILNNQLSKTENVEKDLLKIQRKLEYETNNMDKINKKLKKLKEEHPVKTTIAKIPLIGKVPELVGAVGNLPVIRSIPFVRRLGEVGETERKYHELKMQLRLTKERSRIYRRNAKNLIPILKKYQNGIKVEESEIKSYAKSLKSNYKIDKPNIEISKLYKNKKEMLKRIYDANSMNYIEAYVNAIRKGGKTPDFPDGIQNSNDLAKAINESLVNGANGKTVKPLDVKPQTTTQSQPQTTTTTQSQPQQTTTQNQSQQTTTTQSQPQQTTTQSQPQQTTTQSQSQQTTTQSQPQQTTTANQPQQTTRKTKNEKPKSNKTTDNNTRSNSTFPPKGGPFVNTGISIDYVTKGYQLNGKDMKLDAMQTASYIGLLMEGKKPNEVISMIVKGEKIDEEIQRKGALEIKKMIEKYENFDPRGCINGAESSAYKVAKDYFNAKQKDDESKNQSREQSDEQQTQ